MLRSQQKMRLKEGKIRLMEIQMPTKNRSLIG